MATLVMNEEIQNDICAQAAMKRLVQINVRAWYAEKQVLLIDMLSRHHHMIREDELAFKAKMNVPEVRRALARLLADRMVKQQARTETRKTDGKAVQRTYYHIDYRSAYDCIKYKIFRLQKHFRDLSQTEKSERQYFCPVCHSSFSQLEVTHYTYGDACLFRCPYHKPTEVHILQLEEEKPSESHLKMTRFMESVDPLVRLLRKLENVEVELPEWTAAPLSSSITSDTYQRKPGTAGKRVRVAGEMEEEDTQRVEVDFQSSNAAVRLAAQAEKSAKREQNALPIWHQQSTVVAQKSTVPLTAALNGLKSGEVVSTKATDALLDLEKEDISIAPGEGVPESTVSGGEPSVSGVDMDAGVADDDMAEFYENYYGQFKQSTPPPKGETDKEDEDEDFEPVDTGNVLVALSKEVDQALEDEDDDEEFEEV